MTVITMSRKELTRLRVLLDVADGHLSVADATGLIGVGTETDLSATRCVPGPRPGWSDFPKCGRPSNRELGPVFRETVLAIVRERYGDFGPTLAAEKLSDAGSKPVDVIAAIVFWN
jgi:hypothetical protein